jgi:two-component system, cell cycle response regulator DivK
MSAKILLVEDNAANRYLVTFLLENKGYTVVHAANGGEAVVAAQNEMPDLILMDIQMPEVDGYEAARRLKAEPHLAHIPIVAVTSYAMAGDREKAVRLGFAGYLEKPIVTETFISEISRFIPRKEGNP